MILDLDDSHCKTVFSEDEFVELRTFGRPIIRPIPDELAEKLDLIEKMETPLQAYNYGKTLDYDPRSDRLLAWLSHSLITSSYLFLVSDKTKVESYLETDMQYLLWGFMNTVFMGTDIEAQGIANTNAINRKRSLSAAEVINSLKTGHKMDTIYAAGGMEIGCLEADRTSNLTKAWDDGRLKMPIVMKDMLLEILNSNSVHVNDIHIIGYLISGANITLMDMDSPKGYVTRIRHLDKLTFPSTSNNYISRIVHLLQLAITGKMMMEDTVRLIDRSPMTMSDSNSMTAPILPPCFIPSSNTSKPSTGGSTKSPKRTKSS